MAAFNAPQGGKAGAHESKPKKGQKAGTADAPKGDKHKPFIAPGTRGSKRGFGA